MCDCYGQKCKFCKNKLSIHIADYCTSRENVAVICPDCIDGWLDKGIHISKYKKIWVDKIESREQVFGKLKSGKYKGRIVLLLSKAATAYGICLN